MRPPTAPAPRLSVVVPSVNGWGDLAGCLAALEAQRAEVPLEILVPERCGEAVRREVAATFPAVRILPADPATPIPALRALAFGAASAEAVAVIEDHVLVPPGWARRMLEALDAGAEVVGGSVINAATERLVDWAAFLCEYAPLMPPLPAGPVERLTGNNTVYRRTLLERYRSVIALGRWEDTLHAALRRDGVVLVQRPDIEVGHRKRYTVGEYLGQRYLYARAYAGMRVAGTTPLRRFCWGAGALALPPLLFGRVVNTVWRKGSHRRELTRALPLLALFVSAWGAGEVVGYWFGPGNALGRVR